MVRVSRDEFGSTGVTRGYGFTNLGSFSVFIGLGGTKNTSTGVREYMFFPRVRIPSVRALTTGEVEVTMANGQLARISPDTGLPTLITSAEFTTDARINSRNRGGVEITHYNGLMLDSGWGIGESPVNKINGISVFRDADGHRCSVRNGDVYFIKPGKSIIFKYKTDDELISFLREKCKGLDLGSFTSRADLDSRIW